MNKAVIIEEKNSQETDVADFLDDMDEWSEDDSEMMVEWMSIDDDLDEEQDELSDNDLKEFLKELNKLDEDEESKNNE